MIVIDCLYDKKDGLVAVLAAMLQFFFNATYWPKRFDLPREPPYGVAALRFAPIH
tara:strand:- start:1435 stop:1599 length:165 start_codon:yes stop_codon:yes gene_type:complete